MKVRRFSYTEHGMLMDSTGEFIHENDVQLLLENKKSFLQSCINYNKELESDSAKRMVDHYTSQCQIIEEILNCFRDTK